jgi:hypothetical protein
MKSETGLFDLSFVRSITLTIVRRAVSHSPHDSTLESKIVLICVRVIFSQSMCQRLRPLGGNNLVGFILSSNKTVVGLFVRALNCLFGIVENNGSYWRGGVQAQHKGRLLGYHPWKGLRCHRFEGHVEADHFGLTEQIFYQNTPYSTL